MTSFLGELSL